MGQFAQLLIGAGLGVVASLAAWWIVTRGLRPRLTLAKHISKMPDETGGATWKYRIKIVQPLLFGLRKPVPALDLRLSLSVRVKGLIHSTVTWTAISIPGGGDYAYLKGNRVYRLRIHAIEEPDIYLLPEELQQRVSDGSIELEDLLTLGVDARVRVVVTASHSYSGGRAYALRDYKRDEIICGRFERGRTGLHVQRDDAMCAPGADAVELSSEDEDQIHLQ